MRIKDIYRRLLNNPVQASAEIPAQTDVEALSQANAETPPQAEVETAPQADAETPPKSSIEDIHQNLRELTSLTNPYSQPNINSLTELIRDLDVMKLNIKFFGYELAQRLATAIPPRTNTVLRHVGLKSKASVQADLETDWAAHWLGQLKTPVLLHRKLWEIAYVMQAIYENGHMNEGSRGLGFGCGAEPLPSYLASKGIDITVTDLDPADERAAIWGRTDQLASLERAYRPEFVDRQTFDKHVSFAPVDMNAIPSSLRGYDFCWSICALEHLGSIAHGLDFIENSLEALKPGGLAVHTTEFNFYYDDERNFDNWATVTFQKRHFNDLCKRLEAQGHTVAPLDFNIGDAPMDKFIDVPPYAWEGQWPVAGAHLKVSFDGIPMTCFGLIIRRAH